MNELYILGSILAAAILAALGAVFLVMSDRSRDRILIYLVSLSTGAIFGGTFIHLVPRYANNIGYTHFTGVVVMAGIAGSHLLEKVIHWHCHRMDHDVEPFSYMILAGDGLHNFIDGLLIASSYLVSVSAGIAATVAVMLHKIPKEVGDFGALIHGGFSEKKALAFNIGVGLFMFFGAGFVILASGFQNAEKILIPLVIGNFVYIAGTDLFPEIKEGHDADHFLVFLTFLVGIGLMYSIVLLRPFIPG